MLTDKEAERRSIRHCKKGELIEAGWVSGPLKTAPEEISDIQLWAMRSAFFLGARHVLGLVMATRNEPSKGVIVELLRQLHEELIAFSRGVEIDTDQYERDNGPVH